MRIKTNRHKKSMETKEMNNKVIRLNVISTIFVIIIIAPLLLATYYAVPAADDFSNSSVVLERSDSILKSAALLTAEEYFNWQGTVSATFLLYAASPMLRGGTLAIKLGCAMVTLIYVFSVYFLVFSVARYIFGETRLYVIHSIYCVVLLFATMGRYVGQAFYWFCGAMVHTLPFALCILGIGFTIRMLKSQKKKKNMIMAVICMLIAAGGSLQVAAVCNVVLLGLLLLNWRKIEERKNIGIVFICALLMALLNAGAPGNFVRHGYIDGEYHLLKAVWWAIKSEMDGISFFLLKSPFVIFLLFPVILGYQYGTRKTFEIHKVIFSTLYVILGIAVTNFPVTLGYSKADLPDRCQFIANSIIVFALVLLAILWGAVIGKYNYKWSGCPVRKKLYVVFGGLVLVYILGRTGNFRISDYSQFNICINYANGNLKEFKESYDEVFYRLENGKDKDVEIEYLPEDLDIFHSIGISEDPSNWVNVAVANYYDCKSVSLKSNE